MSNHKYRLTYAFQAHPEGILKKDFPPGTEGATDAVLLMSILYPEDGSLSVAVISTDGRTGKPLSFDEQFKAWALFTHFLSEHHDATPRKKEFVTRVHAAIKDAILAVKEEKSEQTTQPPEG